MECGNIARLLNKLIAFPYFLIPLFLLFFFDSAYAQNPTHVAQSDSAKAAQQHDDSAKTKTPLKVDYLLDPQHNTHLQSIDTSLNGWELTKPVFAEGLGRTFLSDAITASQNLVFTPADYISPVLLIDPFSIYQYNPQSLKFYFGTRRYTELNYVQGPDKDQRIEINYGQLLSKRFFGGFNYLRGASMGYFNEQQTSDSNFDLWLGYYTKNFRYRIFVDAIWDSNSAEENGGLKYDSASQQAETLPVNLNLAQNTTRTRYFNVMQFWSPSFLSPTPDTTAPIHFNSYSHFLTTRFFLSSSFKRNTYTYSDQSLTDGFYQHFYLNANSTQDSIISDNFGNRFGLQGNVGGAGDPSNHPVFYEASLNHDFYSLKQGDQSFIYPAVLNQFTDLSASAIIGSDSSALFWQLNSTYFFYGRNKDDYSADGRLGYHLNKLFAVDVHGSDNLTTPSLLEDEYVSNNFMWQNDFLKKEIKKAGATISSVKYKFSVTADYYMLNNFIYFDTAAMPAQINQQKLMSLKVDDRIRWRRWNLLTKIIYQKANSNDVLRLPGWQTYNSFYYESHFFRSSLFAQIGVDVRYISSYYGDDYMPATRIFYLQDTAKTGGYMALDFFVNFRIKAARLFIKAENLNSVFDNQIYYYVPGYPVRPFAIRFGISMRFFDI